VNTQESSPPRPLSPFTASPRGISLSAELGREGDCLSFAFSLFGDASQLVFPELLPAAKRARRDDLWQHTCLELFWGPPGESVYFELNLAPSGDWNLYQFSGYRQGMRPAEVAAPPHLERSTGDRAIRWRGRLVHDSLAAPIELGATAVLQYADGAREFWALAHRGDKPDFHLRSSFVVSL
jgi:hypothetical protein